MKYRYINRAQEQLLGKSAAEVLSREVREVAGDKVFADIEPNLRIATCPSIGSARTCSSSSSAAATSVDRWS